MNNKSLPTERRTRTALVFVAAASLLALVAALTIGDLTIGASMDGMSMTHYMGLLAVRQPWNLLLFMALPVVLAEVLAITEMVLLLAPSAPRWVSQLSRGAGLLAGPVWVFIGVHLLVHAVLPLSQAGGWRGAADVIAVLSYLAGGVPMFGISLLEAGLVGHTETSAKRLHVIFVATFLVVAHVAMIFGMVDPTVMGWHDAPTSAMAGMGHTMPADPHSMVGMQTPTIDHSMHGMDHGAMPSATPTR